MQRGRGGRGGGDGGRGGGGGDRGRGASPRGSGRGQGGERGRGGGGGRGRGGGGPVEVFRAAGTSSTPPPDAAVRTAEDAVQQSKSTGGAVASLPDISQMSLTDRSPPRPGYGTKGTPVTLWANYLHMTPSKGITIFRYHVDVSPQAAGRKLKRIIQLFIDEGHVSRIKNALATDYKSIIVSCEPLTVDDLKEQVAYRFDEEDVPMAGAQSYNVKLTHSGDFDISDLIDYMSSTNSQAAFAQKEQVLQMLNIVVGHRAKSQPETNILSIGSNRHYPLRGHQSSRFQDLTGGLLAWRGFFTSVRIGASRLLLNLQVKNAAVYQDNIPLKDLINNFADATGHDYGKLDRFLRRVRVETNHLPVKKNSSGMTIRRIKTITGLARKDDGAGQQHPPEVDDFGSGPAEVKFWLSSNQRGPPAQSSRGGAQAAGKGGGQSAAGASTAGKLISVEHYFKNTYNKRVDPNYPVVNVGTSKDPSYLPIDVCRVVAGQPASAALRPQQTQNMIRFAVKKPFENAQAIALQGPGVIGLGSENPTLSRFQIRVSASLLTVPGRVLSGPQVVYNDDIAISPGNGQWNMAGKRFCKSGSAISPWTLVHISQNSMPQNWNESIISAAQAFVAELENCGVGAPPPNMKRAAWFNIRQKSVERAFTELVNSEGPPLKFLLVILDRADTQIYNSVKYAGDIQHGIHTVCVVKNKFTRKVRDGEYDKQYFANVGLKINLKLGGINQSLRSQRLGIIAEGKTMLVGIDVTHPSPGSASTAPSVAGIVASVDKHCGQFPAALSIQGARQEMVTDLGEMFKSRLRLWQSRNAQNLPENIIVYRDGVSEGQYQIVVDEELPALKRACRETYPATFTQRGLPNISIIICGKRHNTRFYPTNANDADNSGNNRNGTVVDRGVTEPRDWDFYLQAHKAIQGTARPAHYYVVHDEIFTKRFGALKQQGQDGPRNAADMLEDLTHNLSYMYGRATKAVSICPPAYYADLVCERARCYLNSHFAPDATPASSQAGDAAPPALPDELNIHPQLRDTMFYI